MFNWWTEEERRENAETAREMAVAQRKAMWRWASEDSKWYSAACPSGEHVVEYSSLDHSQRGYCCEAS